MSIKTAIIVTPDPDQFASAYGPDLGNVYFVVTTADAAIALCEQQAFSVVATDFRLDGQWNGYRLAKRIKSLSACKGTHVVVMMKGYKEGTTDPAWDSHKLWAKNSGVDSLIPRRPGAITKLLTGRDPSSTSLDGVVPVVERKTLDKTDRVFRALVVESLAKVIIDEGRRKLASGALSPEDYAAYLGQQLRSEDSKRRFFLMLDDEIRSQFLQTLGSNTINVDAINAEFTKMVGPLGNRFAREAMAKFGERGVDFDIQEYVSLLAANIVDKKRKAKFLESVQGIF